MPLLSANKIGQSFGAYDVFTDISASVPDNGKIGLVGPNGIGKTTLLLVLAGLSKPTSGTVHKSRNCRIGYLPQEAAQAFAGSNAILYEELLKVFDDLRADERRLREMEEAISNAPEDSRLLDDYGQLLENFEFAGGYTYETRVRQVLQGLGLGADSWDMKIENLSGGQKTRALLARLLLERPDLLILDEPTNHLDVAAVEWLEMTLQKWDGAVLMVSHDRYFLDAVANRIWEMRRDGVENYRGNYSAYLTQRGERWALRKREFADRKARLERELDYIKQHIAGQKTNLAKGKLSRISRELDAIQRGGLYILDGKSWSQATNELGSVSRRPMRVAEAEQAIKALVAPDDRNPTFNIGLQSSSRSGELVIRTHDLHVGYPTKSLFQVNDIELRRRECAAIIGPNGVGKTTLIRTLLGELAPLAGEVKLGASLTIGYFDQAHQRLNQNSTVLGEITDKFNLLEGEARSYLGRFLFSGEDVYKKVSMLSGGERGRLSLALLARQRANLLLLDEPTNHLDIPAQEVLQTVLEQFEGTILLVSHDRFLVDRLATQIWHVEDDRLKVFGGSFSDYRKLEELARIELSGNGKTKSQSSRRAGSPALSKGSATAKRRKVNLVEADIAATETRLATLGAGIEQAGLAGDYDSVREYGVDFAESERRLAELMHEWEMSAHE